MNPRAFKVLLANCEPGVTIVLKKLVEYGCCERAVPGREALSPGEEAQAASSHPSRGVLGWRGRSGNQL
jgi:hypothetical protein